MTNPYGTWVPDPLAPGGYRWRRHDEQPPTHMLPAVAPASDPQGGTIEYDGHTDHQISTPADGQDDLTRFDYFGPAIVNTEKLGPDDEQLEQPTQDPDWRPDGDSP